MVPSEALKILKQEGLRPPRTLTLAITGACNLACFHCWVDAGGEAAAGHVPERILRRLIGEFADLGGTGVCITGGEPLCHPAWLRLLQFCRSSGLCAVSIQTNACLVSDEVVAGLRDLGLPRLSIQVSLDGATAQTHDLVRGEGAYAMALAGLRRLAEGGLADRITIFFTEMRHNLTEIPALLALAEGLGIGSVVTGSLVLCGRAGKEPIVEPPSLDQYEDLARSFASDPRFRALYERLGTIAPLEWLRESMPRTECCTFVENPYLTAGGTLYPCIMCHAGDFAVTGVLGKELAAALAEGARLWNVLLRMSRCRAETNPACRSCPGGFVCAGGCMGRAWGSSGDLQAVDDRCEVRRAMYRRNESLR